MRTIVQVKTPGFEGGFSCSIQTEEWETFVGTLRRLESAIGRDEVASWGNMESNVAFEFKLHKLGALECEFRFSPNVLSIGPTLSGPFEADQTFLRSWIDDAQRIVEAAR